MKWLQNSKYGLYILYTGELQPFFSLQVKILTHIKYMFIDVNKIFAPPLEYTNVTKFKGGGRKPLEYRQMCDFWAHKVFELSEVQRLKSYLR